MFDRVDKLAERIDRLDNNESDEFGNTIEAPVGLERDSGLLRFFNSPLPKFLMLFAAVLCGIALYTQFNPSYLPGVSTETQISSPTRTQPINMINDVKVDAPFVQFSYDDQGMIEYVYLTKMRDDTLHHVYELELVDDAGKTFNVFNGACEIANGYPIVKRTCRTRAPQELSDGSYTIRVSAETTTFSRTSRIESKPVTIQRVTRS